MTRAVRAWPRRKRVVGDGEREDKAGAHRLHVERAPRFMPSCACTLAAVDGKVWSGVAVASTIRSRSLPLMPASFERRARGADGEVGGQFAVGGDTALARCRCAGGSSVRGVETPGEFIVGDDPFRQIAAASGNLRAQIHSDAVTTPSGCAPAGSRVETRQFVADLVRKPFGLKIDRDADGVGETERVGRAVTFDRDAGQSQEHRAVVAARVEPRRKFPQRAAGKQVADARRQRLAERAAQRIRRTAWRGLRRLQRDIAGEPVGDDHIDGAGRDVVALDKAVKTDRRHAAAQPGGGATHRIVSLEVLGADIQQPDRRLRQPQHGAGEDVAHQRELHEVLGVAFDVGAEVEHHALAAPGREQRRDRRPVDARQRLQHEFRDRHQRAGVAGRNDAVGAAVGDRIDRQPHARSPPGAQRQRRLGVARHHLVGMVTVAACGQPRQFGRAAARSGFVAEDQELRVRDDVPARCRRPLSTIAGARSPPIASRAMVMLRSPRAPPRGRRPDQDVAAAGGDDLTTVVRAADGHRWCGRFSSPQSGHSA